jgi:cytochrome c oxidase cbb3-type subunit 1
MYYLIPKLYGRELYSLKLVEIHFWTSTLGIVLYITAMWVAGIMQGLMWRATNDDGTLTYAFMETVVAMHPFYIIRFLGGALFLAGTVVMAYNLAKTVTGAQAEEAVIPVPVAAH